MRIARLALAIVVIVEGVQTNMWMLVALGVFFSIMPLLNVGCCSTAGCGASLKSSTKSKDSAFDNVVYEEIETKK